VLAMTPKEFARICEWDAKITWPENTMFGTTIDRRRLIEYVKELQAALDFLVQFSLVFKRGSIEPNEIGAKEWWMQPPPEHRAILEESRARLADAGSEHV
jgi:hypothetical protein